MSSRVASVNAVSILCWRDLDLATAAVVLAALGVCILSAIPSSLTLEGEGCRNNFAQPLPLGPGKKGFANTDAEILTRLKRAGFSPAVIFDVGASNGAWSVVARGVFPDARYELFEPLLDCNPDYDRGIAQVRKMPNIRLHACALADQPGRMTLHMMGARGAGSSLIGKGYAASKPIDVAVETIDGLIAGGTVLWPDLIKMDIQGGELAALKGATERALPHASVVTLEMWLQRTYGPETPLMSEIMEFLYLHGFVPFEFGDEFRTPNGTLGSKDVWFVRKTCGTAKQIGRYV